MAKNKAITIALLLVLTFTMIALPAANAHDPPWTIPSWTYVTVSPNPIGVGQEALIVFWADQLPRTASGEYGDRFTFTVDVTKPGGSIDHIGPITSDPVGGGYYLYTPEEAGNYTIVATLQEHKYTGVNPPPGGYTSSYGAWINDTYLGSTSTPAELTVQEEPIPSFADTPLPMDYWTRPIYPTNRAWAKIAGNWLDGSQGNMNLYTDAPATAHIVWKKPIQEGGIAGEPYSDISYHTGSAYETMWSASIIIGGKLYYNEPKAPRYGWYCVDLRTGEQIFFQNSTGPIQIGSYTGAHIGATEIPWQYPQLSFGQIYDYDSPNQHGTHAYVWSTYREPSAVTYSYKRLNGSIYSFTAPTGSTTWQMYDSWTGNWICSIANVPSGVTSSIGPDGSLLIYVMDSAHGWMALWNSSKALEFPNNNLEVPYSNYLSAEAFYWMWREPIGRVVDGTHGYSWNVSIPTDIPRLGRDIIVALTDKLVGTSGLSDRYNTDAYKVYSLSLKPGNEGTLLWKKNYDHPAVINTTIDQNLPVDEDAGVFCLGVKETLQWYGYDLNTGNQIWGPTDPQPPMDMYGKNGVAVYGKLYSIGYSGVLHCYDLKDGKLLWASPLNNGGLEGPYQYWSVGSGAGISVAGGKIYVTTGEHSHTQPLYRGWSIYCFDAESGQNLWNFTGLMASIAVADGYAVSLDNMDNSIYCFGKGQTTTTVMASPDVSAYGDSVLVKGSVTDQSPGAAGTPAIGDAYMTEWMEYLYHQRPMPTASGVQVKLETLDPNGNFYEIGTTTSDANGMYGYAFTPEVPGLYTIIATFEGSNSYFRSHAETFINVEEQPQASPTSVPQAETPTGMYILGSTIGIIIAIVIVGLVVVMMLRKRP